MSPAASAVHAVCLLETCISYFEVANEAEIRFQDSGSEQKKGDTVESHEEKHVFRHINSTFYFTFDSCVLYS